jgi:hypothetical protein
MSHMLSCDDWKLGRINYMDSIVALALVGTANSSSVDAATGTPVDALLSELPEDTIERKLLLSAGSLAVYRQAGYQPQKLANLPAPARAETLRLLSPQTATLITRLLQNELPGVMENDHRNALLSEALKRLALCGMCLPPQLLPLALSVATKKLRPLFLPVLGERARWLSQFNRDWLWAQAAISYEANGLPIDADLLWSMGTTSQRVEIMHHMRASDPQKAREALEAVWKQERADVRSELLQTLATGLTLADEDLLERALDDRSSNVREVAASLLTALPQSAWNRRMQEVAAAFLQRVQDKVVVTPPKVFERAWVRDGIVEKPPKETGQRQWWLKQILARVNPSFWEAHLGADPDALLQEIHQAYWGDSVIEGWSTAAVDYRASAWIMPIWNYWYKLQSQPSTDASAFYQLQTKLLHCMSQSEAEGIMLLLLNENIDTPKIHWESLISELPQPWSVDFSWKCLRLFHEKYKLQAGMEKLDYDSPIFLLCRNLLTIALTIPPVCFAEAEHLWQEDAEKGIAGNAAELQRDNWYFQQTQLLLRTFIDIINLRKQIYEEIV